MPKNSLAKFGKSRRPVIGIPSQVLQEPTTTDWWHKKVLHLFTKLAQVASM